VAGETSAASSRSASRQVGPVKPLRGRLWVAIILMGSGLFLVVMMGLAIGGEHGFLAMWRMQRQMAQLAYEVRMIEQENRDLGREIQRLRHDMGYIEKIAREELGLVRPGELVFEFVE
jgi:cell division protein FtsB